MKKLTIQLLTLTCLVFVSSLFAGNRPGALTVTAGGGYYFFDSKRNVDNTGTWLVKAGYDLTCHWGLEGLLAGFTTDFKKSVDDDRRIRGTIFNFDGVYHFTPGGIFEPYVAAGVGLTGLNPTLFDANNEGNVNAAVGAQMFLTNYIAVYLEARDLYTWVGGKNDVFINGGISGLIDFC